VVWVRVGVGESWWWSGWERPRESARVVFNMCPVSCLLPLLLPLLSSCPSARLLAFSALRLTLLCHWW